MKKAPLLFLLSTITLFSYSQTTFHVDIKNVAQSVCGDSITLRAEVPGGTLLSLDLLWNEPDSLHLHIVEKGSGNVLRILKFNVTGPIDTLLSIPAGEYYLRWAKYGARIKNPVISGSVGSWFIQNGAAQLEFHAGASLSPDQLSFKWRGFNETSNEIKVPAIKDRFYKVTVMYIVDGSTVSDSIRVDTNPLEVHVWSKTTTCGESVRFDEPMFNKQPAGVIKYSWAPSAGLDNASVATPTASVKVNTKYVLTVTTQVGCVAKDSLNITVDAASITASICAVSVHGEDKNLIVWEEADSDKAASYLIFRESNMTDLYDQIAEVSSLAENFVIDNGANANIQSNKYRLAIKDVCGFTSAASQPHKTMHLTVNRGVGNSWNLIWEKYEGLNVASYKIFRGPNENNMVEIATVSGSNSTYTDEGGVIGGSHYEIEVVLPKMCTASTTLNVERSTSNRVSTVEVITGLQEEGASLKSFFVYPNPVCDRLKFSVEGYTHAGVSITDMKGAQMLLHTANTFEIDVSILPSGFYIIRVPTENGTLVDKFFKQ